MKAKLTFFISVLLCMFMQASAKPVTAWSPDHSIQLDVELKSGQLCYTVLKDNTIILRDSELSMNVGKAIWGQENKSLRKRIRTVEETVTFPVPRKYRSLDVVYTSLILPFREYDIEFRIYNEGVAYRFIGKTSGPREIISENVSYCFDEDAIAYTQLTDKLQNWYEEKIKATPISELPDTKFSIMPVLVKTKGLNVLLGEADLYDYSGMYLKKSDKKEHSLHAVFSNYPSKQEYVEWDNKRYATERFDYIVKTDMKRKFPWRIIGIYENDTDILASEFVYLLSQKTTEDYSWLKPGQALWDWWNDRNVYGVDFVAGINTAYYRYLIEFAAEHHVPYILIDEGWSRNNNLLDINPNVDMDNICKYAAEKNVGVLLWAKWVDVDRQMEEFFQELSAWGCKGCKIDFMDRNDAEMVDFYERVATTATRYHMMVDLHGSYPSEGMRAKYPNLLTREGVIGLEYNKMRDDFANPCHDCQIPFIRMWAGPMDYTPGAMLNEHPETHFRCHHEPMSMGTRCHQIAMYIVYESPLQMLSDSPSKYIRNMECFKFMTEVPTIWDNTIALHSEIGKHVGFAREKGDIWYIGYLGGMDPQDIEVNLSFLPQGEYEIEIFRDGINVERNAEDYIREQKTIRSGDTLQIHLGSGGGYAARLTRK